MVNVNEALGYTHDQTLESSFTLIEGLLQEYAYIRLNRNKKVPETGGIDEEYGEYDWVQTIDFDTGKPKKVKRFRMV